MRVVELDAAEIEHLGWTRFGVIPHYAVLPNGDLAENAFYYLRLTNIG